MNNKVNIIHMTSKIFQPISIVPKEAVVKNKDAISKSQRLMLELGLIKQASPGSFHFLPLAVRALEKLVRIVDKEMCNLGSQKVIFPTLTNAKLWEKSGRLNDIKSELFTLKDRHDDMYVLSPTHEEVASELIGSIAPLSYKQFPLRLHQITTKFRDEMKPRFGLMRGKQFIMKDMYSFDLDEEKAKETYEDVCNAYDKILQKIGIDYVKVLGLSGTMGGSLSHEFQYLAPIGEDQILICRHCNFASNIEMSHTEKCPKCEKKFDTKISTGIEIGHTFFLGQKYTKAFKATYLSNKGKPTTLFMGSYGIGISRLLAASLEMLSLEQELRWPDVLAPYLIMIIPPKEGSKEEQFAMPHLQKLYSTLNCISGFEENILIDDRNQMTIGRRLVDAKRMGYPYVVIIGPKAAEDRPLFEVIHQTSKISELMSYEQIVDYFQTRCLQNRTSERTMTAVN